MNHPSMAPYGSYPTGDGKELVIAVQNDREWTRLCATVLDCPELVEDPRFATNNARVANRPAMDEVLVQAFSKLDLEQLELALGEAAIAFGAVNSVRQLSEHPQVRRWPMTVNGEDVAFVAPPLKTPFDDGFFRGVPSIGEHSEAIREEFAS
jgi:crotonobetainyl-CoA:carnitine CoA-transferase CaiB-like acyl-CoA transferase